MSDKPCSFLLGISTCWNFFSAVNRLICFEELNHKRKRISLSCWRFWCHSLQWGSFWNCHQYEARIFLFVLNVIDIHNRLDLVYSINKNTTEIYFQLFLTLLLYSPFSYINNTEIEVILSIYNVFHSSLKYRLKSNLVFSKLRDYINGKEFFITCYDIDTGVFAVQKRV